jgi:hypothetical protein
MGDKPGNRISDKCQKEDVIVNCPQPVIRPQPVAPDCLDPPPRKFQNAQIPLIKRWFIDFSIAKTIIVPEYIMQGCACGFNHMAKTNHVAPPSLAGCKKSILINGRWLLPEYVFEHIP